MRFLEHKTMTALLLFFLWPETLACASLAKTVMFTSMQNYVCRKWQCTPVISALWEAEVGTS